MCNGINNSGERERLWKAEVADYPAISRPALGGKNVPRVELQRLEVCALFGHGGNEGVIECILFVVGREVKEEEEEGGRNQIYSSKSTDGAIHSLYFFPSPSTPPLTPPSHHNTNTALQLKLDNTPQGRSSSSKQVVSINTHNPRPTTPKSPSPSLFWQACGEALPSTPSTNTSCFPRAEPASFAALDEMA
jgi:hypothetical protein